MGGSEPRFPRLPVGTALAALIALSFFVVAGVALGPGRGTGLAQSSTTYTGCLDSNGTLFNVATGDAPKFACRGRPIMSWKASAISGPRGGRGPRGAQGRRGRIGETGPQGERGPQGRRGAQEPMVVVYTMAGSSEGSGGRLMVAEASCRAGDVLTGGGFTTTGTLVGSTPLGGQTPTGWRALALADESSTSVVEAHAVCLDMRPPSTAQDGGQ